MKVDMCKWMIVASALEVRTDVTKPSKVLLKRNTIVETTGVGRQFKKEAWYEIVTLSEPIVKGFVQAKYLAKL